MRPWLVGLIVFAGAYAGASLAGVPWLCSNPQYAEMLGFVRACARSGGLPASKMALIYFASVGLGLIAAIMIERLAGKRPAAATATPPSPEKEKAAVAAIEEILPKETAALAASTAPVAAPASTPPVAHPSALASAAVAPVVEAAKPAPASTIKVTPAVAPPPRPAPQVTPPPVQKPSPPSPPVKTPNFHDDAEFLKKIWGLDAMDAAAAAELGARYVDESMLSAIHFGTDPKMHLSKLAQLMLQQDPDLKSHGVRGVVKHIALRLRELGVTPGSAVGA